MAEAVLYLVSVFDADMNLLNEATVADEFNDGPAFFAHQALHADRVSCVEVLQGEVHNEVPVWKTVLRRCDPDVKAGDAWVAAAGGEQQ